MSKNVFTSPIFGTLFSFTFPAKSKLAQIIGRAAFFEPETFTTPDNLLFPFIISIIYFLKILFNNII
jgi:hypothetical protein